ncbi:hypothetical protein ACIA8R_44020 [Nonomuraea sp. NPDC051191]|uniref:hypothetical protein n=1 Tax=Nonomuraea sp. NPDC051191 TaxID=3364372 RepID=UPI0037AB14E0
MWWHSTDYLKRDGRQRGMLVHRGFWAHQVPRLMLWCRLRGHKPVVDGYGPTPPGTDAARWVVCDRCGVRPDPQGNLPVKHFDVGQPYNGKVYTPEFTQAMQALGSTTWGPGPWPDRPTGTLGGELVLGKTFGVFSAQLTIGAAGADHPVSGHMRVWPLGALYLHTEAFGTWLQRRLVPEGYESRVINVSIGEWAIRWKWWARENHWSRDDPWWMHGSISLDLVQALFGPKRYSYETVEGPVLGWIKMPEGDSHQVQLTLQRQRLGRPRLKRAKWAWSVDWETPNGGIPTKTNGRNRITGSSVHVPDEAVETRSWDVLACAIVARKLSDERAQYGYRAQNTEG